MTNGAAAEVGQHGGEKLRWVKLPLQARSREKLERFIAAAERLINERGFQATSVPDIAREAGCSVGLFYTRFRDKQELLRFLFEHYLGEAVATARAVLQPGAFADVPLAALIRTAVQGMVRIHRGKPGLVYAFYESIPHDPVLGERVLAVHHEIEGLARAMLVARGAEITHPDPDTAARFGIRLVVGVLQQRALASRTLPAEDDLGWTVMAEEMTRTLLGYFGVAAAAPPPRRLRSARRKAAR
ncbi:MAG: TetR/AcrR family transcriptional regulator [Deltaproteobacteria bacterium]|nr:TetR/AcrR family transcriptional regulator [Deltaproteobacteria bacterium]